MGINPDRIIIGLEKYFSTSEFFPDFPNEYIILGKITVEIEYDTKPTIEEIKAANP